MAFKGQRTSQLVDDKKAADRVASMVREQLRIGGFDFDKKPKKQMPLFKDFAAGFMETYSV